MKKERLRITRRKLPLAKTDKCYAKNDPNRTKCGRANFARPHFVLLSLEKRRMRPATMRGGFRRVKFLLAELVKRRK